MTSARATSRGADAARIAVWRPRVRRSPRLDVWLLYSCLRCGVTEKRRLLRRVPVAAIPPARLDAYHRNDVRLAWSHA